MRTNRAGEKLTRANRVGKLTTVGEVAAELGRLYRAARRNDVDSAYASRLAGILAVMRQCLETAELERRLDAIEAKVANQTPFKPRLVS